MKNRIISLILIFAIIFTSVSFALDGTETNQELVDMMTDQGYENILDLRSKGVFYLNPHVYREQQKIVYSANSSYSDLRSSMTENQGSDNIDSDGDYRYLGYNTSGNTVANELFEPDVSPYDGHLNTRDWIKSSSAIGSWSGKTPDLISYMLNTVVEVSSTVGTDTITNILGNVSDSTAKEYAIYQSSPGLKVKGSVKMYHEIISTGQVLYWVMEIPSLDGNITNTVTVDSISDKEILVGENVDFKVDTTHKASLSVLTGLDLDSVVKDYTKTITIENSTTNETIYTNDTTYNDFTTSINANKTENASLASSKFSEGVNNIKVTVTQTLNPTALGDSKLTTTDSTNFNVIVLNSGDVLPTLRVEPNPLSIKQNGNGTVNITLTAGIAGTDKIPQAWKFYLNNELIATNSGSTQSSTATVTKIIDTSSINTQNWDGRVEVYLTASEFVTATAASQTEVYATTPPDTNTPPYGTLNLPSVIETGITVYPSVSVGDKEDPTSALTVYFSFPPSATNNMTKSGGSATFSKEGEFTIDMVVIDSGGKQYLAQDTITVIPPTPSANLTITGNEKQYRKIDISLLNSIGDTGYPINWNKTELTITPLDGQTASSIYAKVSGVLNNNKNFTGQNSISIQSNKVGRVEIKGTVFNSIGESDTVYKILDIAEDKAPVANLVHLAKLYRDPSNSNIAQLDVFNDSYSPDGDTISNIKLSIRYDNDDDGSYIDEPSTVKYNSTFKQNFLISESRVGNRQLTLEVTESYVSLLPSGALAPRLTGLVTTKFKVDNIAPTTTTDIEVSKEKIEVKYVNVNNYNTDAYLNSHYNNILKPYLSSQYDVDFSYINTDTEGYMRNETFIWHIEEDSFLPYESTRSDQQIHQSDSRAISQVSYRTYINRMTGDIISLSPYTDIYYDEIGMYRNVSTWDISLTQDSKYYYFRPDMDSIRFSGDYVGKTSSTKYYINESEPKFYNSDLYSENSIMLEYANTRPRGSSTLDPVMFFDIETSLPIGDYWYKNIDEYTLRDELKEICGNDYIYMDSEFTKTNSDFFITIVDNYLYMDVPFKGNWIPNTAVIGFDITNNKNHKIIVPPNLMGEEKVYETAILKDKSNNKIVFKTKESDPEGNFVKYIYTYPSDMINSHLINTNNLVAIDNKYGDSSDFAYNRYTNYKPDGYMDYFFSSPERQIAKVTNGMLGERYSNKFGYTEDIFQGGTMIEPRWDGQLTEYYEEIQKTIINDEYYIAYDKLTYHKHPRISTLDLYKYDWSNTFIKNVNNISVNPDVQTFVVFFMKDYKKLIGDCRYLFEFQQIITDKNIVPIFIDSTGTYLNYFDALNVARNGASTTNENDLESLISNRIISEINIIDGILYITKNIGLELSSLYSDYESDPMYDSKFEVEHVNPNFFENSEGLSSLHGKSIASNNTLDKVGEYFIQAMVQDNPTLGNALLAEYRKWSNNKNQLAIRLHRKPIVDISLDFLLNGTVYDTTFVNNSYDLDHASLVNNGISETKILWKEENDLTYQTSIPSQVGVGIYTLIVKVKDIEGVWAEKTYEYELTGADVSITLSTVLSPSYPTELRKDDSLVVTSTVVSAYPISFVKANLNGQEYLLTKSTQIGNTSTWKKTIIINDGFGNIDYSLNTIAENSVGIQDNDSDLVKIVTNQAPTLNITSTSPALKRVGNNITVQYTPTDPDGDNLDVRIVVVNLTTNKTVANFTNTITTLTPKSTTILSSAPLANYRVTVTVTDPSGETASDIALFSVVNQAPTINITNISPTVKYTGDDITVQYTPGDPDGDNLDVRIVVENLTTSKIVADFTNTITTLTPKSTTILTSAPPADYRATVTVTDPSGETASDTTLFSVNGINVSVTASPTPIKAGYWVTINVKTTGKVENCIIEILSGSDVGMLLYPTNQHATTSDLNTWTIKYHTWDYEPDGNIPFAATAYKDSYSVSNNANIVILGSYLEDQKATTKD